MNFMNFDLNFCISLTKEEAFLLLLPILYANSGNPSERCILSSQSLKRCTQNYITFGRGFSRSGTKDSYYDFIDNKIQFSSTMQQM